MQTVLSFAQGLVSEFVVSDTYTRVGVVQFNSAAEVLTSLSSDAAAIDSAIAGGGPSSGGTSISDGISSALGLLSGVSPSPPPPLSEQLGCSFETDKCGWVDTRPDSWTRTSGSTPSYGTGPSGDHTTGSGYYLFTEATDRFNKLHQLESPHFSLQQDATLSFFYRHPLHQGLQRRDGLVDALEQDWRPGQ